MSKVEITTRTDTTVKPSNTRWIGLALIFVICVIAYIDRTIFAVATSTIMKEIQVTPIQIGLANTMFTLGYAILQIPGALWARKYGGRKVITIALFMWSIFTLLTGFMGGITSLLLIRFLFGLGEGPLFPAQNGYNLRWFTLKDRAFVNAAPIAGAYLAPIIAPPLVVWVLTTLGMKWVFALASVLGFVIMIVWYVWARDNPADHRWVNSAELAHIRAGQEIEVSATQNSYKIPWRRFFGSRSFWAIGVTYFLSIYIVQFFVYWLPYFLQTALNMNLKSMGYAATLPWIFIFIAAMIIGPISDGMVRAGKGLFVSRNVLVIIGFAVAAVLLYISSFVTNPWAVVWLMSIGLGFVGITATIPWAISTDVGGEYSAAVIGWMQTWGIAGAAVMSYVTAYVGTNYGWKAPLVFLAVLAVLGIVSTALINTGTKIRVSGQE